VNVTWPSGPASLGPAGRASDIHPTTTEAEREGPTNLFNAAPGAVFETIEMSTKHRNVVAVINGSAMEKGLVPNGKYPPKEQESSSAHEIESADQPAKERPYVLLKTENFERKLSVISQDDIPEDGWG
jgi:hypothetical protein